MNLILKIGFLLALILSVSCSASKNTNTVERDGSSVEKAVIVKSISEEYEYIRKVCYQCRVVQQSLREEKGKPYDVLEVVKPNGEKASYWFDISKFFGKGIKTRF